MVAFANVDTLRRSIDHAGLGMLSDRIMATARPTILFTRRQCADDPLPVGTSKIGGLPDLPSGFDWPYRPAHTEASVWERSIRDRRGVKVDHYDELLIASYYRPFPLAFRAQIDLAALADDPGFDPDLPRRGFLHIFEDVTGDGSGEGTRTFWHDVAADRLERRPVPDAVTALSDARGNDAQWRELTMAEVLTPHSALSIPHHWVESGAASRNALFDLVREPLHPFHPVAPETDDAAGGDFGDQLGGWPMPIQNDPEPTFLKREGERIEPGDVSVRQIFCWGGEHYAGTRLPIAEGGGDGYTHVLIERAALLARRFEAAGSVYQCD